ncbi:MAG: hypothetical protein ABIZ70_10615, partial [Gemmatimonadales bacterium]
AIFYVLSQRSTLPLELFAQSNASRLLAPAGPATALLLSWQYPYETELVGPRLQARCSTLTVLFHSGEGTLLLGAVRAPEESRPDACAAIASLLRAVPPESDEEP